MYEELVLALSVEQQTLTRLMTENAPHPIVKPWSLSHALSRCVKALRSLKAGAITIREAMFEYCEIATISQSADLTLWYERHKAQREQVRATINDRVRDWYERGWVTLDNGVIEILPAGAKDVATDMEMTGLELRRREAVRWSR